MTSTAAIATNGLAKRYGDVRALSDVSLRVEPGEIFGFLGPNGAGKTTTIRVLLGLIAPSAGEAIVLGRPASAAPACRTDIGYLPGELSFWPALSGARTLTFLADLTGRAAVWRDELTERVGLAAADLARPVRTYSDGMKQKLGIVQALQCAPRLVLLDEPTKGLDPLVQQAFYDLLRELPGRGVTVFFSSHVLPEVERVCHRVAMLRRGAVAMTGDIDQIRQAMPRRVVVQLQADVDASRWAAMGEAVSIEARRVELLVHSSRVPDLVRMLASLPVADVIIEPPSLEAAFLERYR